MDASSTRTFLTDDQNSWIDVFQLPENLKPNEKEFEDLWNLHPQEHSTVFVGGKWTPIPRYQQAYGKPYKFSGKTHNALPIPDIIQKYLDYANELGYDETYASKFNMALVNWYRDGQDYIGAHSDDERDLVKNKNGETVVFSISLGQTRKFRFHPKTDGKKHVVELKDGCVVVMGGQTQKTHKHSVPKASLSTAPERRINLTFRIFK